MMVYRAKVLDLAAFGETVFDEVWDSRSAAEKAGQAWIDGSEEPEHMELRIEYWEVNVSCGHSTP